MKKMTPLKAVRARCLNCCADSSREVRLCPATGCPLHPIRSGKNGGKVKSVLKTIRAKCRDCSDGLKDVAECALKDCPLYPFRLGMNPNRKGATIPKNKRAASEKKPPLHGPILRSHTEDRPRGLPRLIQAGFSSLGE